MLTDQAVNSMLDSGAFDACSLHSDYSAVGGNEISGGSPAYTRTAVAMATAVGRSRELSNAPVFNVPAGVGVKFIGLWESSGNIFKGMQANGGIEKGFQVDIANDTILSENHNLVDGNKVVFYGGTPPTGLVEGTVYFIINSSSNTPDSFQVSLTQAGGLIPLTAEGSTQCKLSGLVEEVFVQQGTLQVDNYKVGLDG